MCPDDRQVPKRIVAKRLIPGIKPSNKRYDDIALVVFDRPCAAAALFTRNIFKAAPVTLSQAILRERREDYQGVVVSSGHANTVGVKGAEASAHTLEMVRTADQCLEPASSPAESVNTSDIAAQMLVMSTGVSDQKLPIAKVKAAIPEAHAGLGSTHMHWMKVAQALCTTNTFPKCGLSRQRYGSIPIDGGDVLLLLKRGEQKDVDEAHPKQILEKGDLEM
ncbi:hypothetical protein LTR85_009306 [Meristemomyces frigidus]|nr:hypothetical protein LTR85_009306 [Meristemomyces frigidus]